LHCRWTGNNGPEQTDYIAMRNLIDATPKSVKRFILTTSAGVDRSNKIPFSILNLFGEALRALGLPCLLSITMHLQTFAMQQLEMSLGTRLFYALHCVKLTVS